MDWFASQQNDKLPLFFFRVWNPKSAGVDAFIEFCVDNLVYLYLQLI